MLPSPPAEMDYRAVIKRKRSVVEAEETRDCTFQLENLSTSTFLSFEPITKLLRAHLPLSWLASTTSDSPLANGSILTGQVQHTTAWEYSVLVARLVPNGGLVALEKVEQDCFVVYPLQPFVTRKWVQDASIGAAPPVTLQMMLHYLPAVAPASSTNPINPRRTPSLTSDPTVNVTKSRKGAAARLSILSQMGKTEDATPSPTSQERPTHREVEGGYPAIATANKHEVTQPSTPAQSMSAVEIEVIAEEPETDMLAPIYLQQRYLEHLYMSKTSLAYYTKGPLSRARARARGVNASMTMVDLAAYYRDSVLPAKKMDLKYKESIKGEIANAVKNSASSDVTLARKRGSKKTKLGKDGLWPMEGHYITRWWEARASTAATREQQDCESRDAVASLRMREAQMQIILILETLSIEAKQADPASKGPLQALVPDNSDVKVESIEHEPLSQTGKAVKSAKKRDLETDLEVIADKLCIWHSIGLEGAFLSVDSGKTGDDCDHVHSRDRLRNFCTDVLIPFYSFKLPSLCKSLCRTLAGPEVFEQAQKALRIKQDIPQCLPPGTVVKRGDSSTSGTLEPFLSGTRPQQPSPPALIRSSTLPPVPQFKREPSEVLQRSLSRQTSISFSGREVDLEADALAAASKKRKLHSMAIHKKDLASAIQALKKPNRHVASKTYMDEVEQRKIDLVKPVLITATPKANRRRTLNDAVDDSTLLPRTVENTTIYSSTTKLRGFNASISASRSSSKKRAVLAAIHDTPSRQAGRKSDPLQLMCNPEDVLTTSDQYTYVHKDIFATPSKPKQKAISAILSTPSKKLRNTSGGQENELRVPEMASKTMDRAMAMPSKQTIYDTLGWNDDIEIRDTI